MSDGIMSSGSDAGDNVGYLLGLKIVVGIAVGRKDGATIFDVGGPEGFPTTFLFTISSKVMLAPEEYDEEIPVSMRNHNIAVSFIMLELFEIGTIGTTGVTTRNNLWSLCQTVFCQFDIMRSDSSKSTGAVEKSDDVV